MSPLDKALSEVKNDNSKQGIFYNQFLNTQLYIPTNNKPDTEGTRRSQEGDSISPMFIEIEGKVYLMIFDSRERLSAWAKKEIGFVALPGHVVVSMMPAEHHWVLNAETEFTKMFFPNEILWLKKYIQTVSDQEHLISADTKVLIGVPTSVPKMLFDALNIVLTRNEEVKKAYLAQIHFQAKGEAPHLAIVLEINPIAEVALKGIRNDLSMVFKSILGPNECVDIILKEKSGLGLEVSKIVDAFYNA